MGEIVVSIGRPPKRPASLCLTDAESLRWLRISRAPGIQLRIEYGTRQGSVVDMTTNPEAGMDGCFFGEKVRGLPTVVFKTALSDEFPLDRFDILFEPPPSEAASVTLRINRDTVVVDAKPNGFMLLVLLEKQGTLVRDPKPPMLAVHESDGGKRPKNYLHQLFV